MKPLTKDKGIVIQYPIQKIINNPHAFDRHSGHGMTWYVHFNIDITHKTLKHQKKHETDFLFLCDIQPFCFYTVWKLSDNCHCQ